MCRLDTQKRYCQFCNIRSRSAQTWVLNFRRCDHIPVKFKCIPPNSKVNSASVIVKRFEIPTRLRSMLHNISPTRHSWTQTTRGSSWIRESKLSSWVHQSFKLRPDFSVNLDVNSHFACGCVLKTAWQSLGLPSIDQLYFDKLTRQDNGEDEIKPIGMTTSFE